MLATPWLLTPSTVRGDWPRQAFLSQDAGTALRALIGNAQILWNDAVALDVPEFSENGAVVRVGVSTGLSGADSIILISEPNPFPMIAPTP